jgi:hypothetical protein
MVFFLHLTHIHGFYNGVTIAMFMRSTHFKANTFNLGDRDVWGLNREAGGRLDQHVNCQ